MSAPLEAVEPAEITLAAASVLLAIPLSVLHQTKRREKIGLHDAVIPRYCDDHRRCFVTMESVRQVQQNRALMRRAAGTIQK